VHPVLRRGTVSQDTRFWEFIHRDAERPWWRSFAFWGTLVAVTAAYWLVRWAF
jgi:hypothetical protein